MDPYFRNKMLRHCPCGDEGTACRQFRDGYADVNRARANDVPPRMNPWSWYYRQLSERGRAYRAVDGRCKSKREVRSDLDYDTEPDEYGGMFDEPPPAATPAPFPEDTEAPAQQRAMASKGRSRVREREFTEEEMELAAREEKRARHMTRENWGPAMQALADEGDAIRAAERKKRSDAAKKGWAKKKQRDRNQRGDDDDEPAWLKR